MYPSGNLIFLVFSIWMQHWVRNLFIWMCAPPFLRPSVDQVNVYRSHRIQSESKWWWFLYPNKIAEIHYHMSKLESTKKPCCWLLMQIKKRRVEIISTHLNYSWDLSSIWYEKLYVTNKIHYPYDLKIMHVTQYS